jgi:hypothetical protein
MLVPDENMPLRGRPIKAAAAQPGNTGMDSKDRW